MPRMFVGVEFMDILGSCKRPRVRTECLDDRFGTERCAQRSEVIKSARFLDARYRIYTQVIRLRKALRPMFWSFVASCTAVAHHFRLSQGRISKLRGNPPEPPHLEDFSVRRTGMFRQSELDTWRR